MAKKAAKKAVKKAAVKKTAAKQAERQAEKPVEPPAPKRRPPIVEKGAQAIQTLEAILSDLRAAHGENPSNKAKLAFKWMEEAIHYLGLDVLSKSK